MGLAASQARLLLLTARKSDLEYRAQCITNTEMILAMQTEAVARKYSQKISNQALFYTNADNAYDKNVALNSSNFALIIANAVGAGYKLYIGGTDTEWQPEKATSSYKYTNHSDEDVVIAGETVAPGKSLVINEARYNAIADADEKGKFTEIPGYGNAIGTLSFLEMLNNGSLEIRDASGNKVSLSANTGFVEAYYTDDDTEAEAEYKRETAAIQVKEKRLQMELQQVESQQKACETEMESVKKVIEKNIEKTFKVFS